MSSVNTNTMHLTPVTWKATSTETENRRVFLMFSGSNQVSKYIHKLFDWLFVLLFFYTLTLQMVRQTFSYAFKRAGKSNWCTRRHRDFNLLYSMYTLFNKKSICVIKNNVLKFLAKNHVCTLTVYICAQYNAHFDIPCVQMMAMGTENCYCCLHYLHSTSTW